MTTPAAQRLPPRDEMLAAMLASDAAYEGVFYTAVRTTGVFCRPTCPARKPRPENVEFFASAEACLAAGYRPCKRCRPRTPRPRRMPACSPRPTRTRAVRSAKRSCRRAVSTCCNCGAGADSITG